MSSTRLEEPAWFSGSGYVGINTLGAKHEPPSIQLSICPTCPVPLGKAAQVWGHKTPSGQIWGHKTPSVVQMSLLDENKPAPFSSSWSPQASGAFEAVPVSAQDRTRGRTDPSEKVLCRGSHQLFAVRQIHPSLGCICSK